MKTSIHGDLQLVFVFKCKCALPWEYIHVLCYYRRRPSAFLFFPFLLKNFPKTAGLKISLGPPLWVTWNSGLTFRSTRCFALACSYSSSLCAVNCAVSCAPFHVPWWLRELERISWLSFQVQQSFLTDIFQFKPCTHKKNKVELLHM